MFMDVVVLTVLIGVALWGLHMGLTQRLLAALVVGTAPAHLRGTAFGLFNLASGATLLAASVVAGALWSAVGPEATFVAGATFALLATAGLAIRARERGRQNGRARPCEPLGGFYRVMGRGVRRPLIRSASAGPCRA